MSKKLDKLNVPKKYDKRFKISDEVKELIKIKHSQGRSIHSLSKEFEVSRRSIQFILYPERNDHNKELFRLRGGSQIYTTLEMRAEAIKKHRRYKRELLNKGLI